MLFNSFAFIFLFLPVTVAGFFLLGRWAPKSAATAWLVLASLFFYGYWDVRYVPLLLASVFFNYLVGRQIEKLAARVPSPLPKRGETPRAFPPGSPEAALLRRKKLWLFFGIAGNVALLGYFKYTDFFLGSLNALLGEQAFSLPQIVLPLGISFYTFTQTAYLVDAYRGEARNRSLLTYLEFVTIFPHLIAGPIINHKQMIPQFVAASTFSVHWENMAQGLTLFSFGLFKKVVLADSFSPWVAEAFSHADGLTCLEAWIGTLSYTFQLYFDFSGYSEMAMGLGLLLNLRLPQNFDSPYRSLSIIDFWRRWHMTLGSWVKWYLYIPMGGNRHGYLRKMRNLFVSMLVIGLWHGAGWTYVAWGALHGVYLMADHTWRRLAQPRDWQLPRPLCWALTFAAVVLGWVLFRASSFTEAFSMLRAMADVSSLALPLSTGSLPYVSGLASAGLPLAPMTMGGAEVYKALGLLAFSAVLLALVPNPVRLMARFRPSVPWLLLALALMLYTLLSFSHLSDFLYFQF